MSAASGLAPPTVARLDHRDFTALERACADRWAWPEELLATLCELVHHLIAVQLARGGVKPGPPLRIPRPGKPDTPRRTPAGPRVSWRALATMTNTTPRSA